MQLDGSSFTARPAGTQWHRSAGHRLFIVMCAGIEVHGRGLSAAAVVATYIQVTHAMSADTIQWDCNALRTPTISTHGCKMVRLGRPSIYRNSGASTTAPQAQIANRLQTDSALPSHITPNGLQALLVELRCAPQKSLAHLYCRQVTLLHVPITVSQQIHLPAKQSATISRANYKWAGNRCCSAVVAHIC